MGEWREGIRERERERKLSKKARERRMGKEGGGRCLSSKQLDREGGGADGLTEPPCRDKGTEEQRGEMHRWLTAATR
eukprot:3799995-Rhodomonas_salina.1